MQTISGRNALAQTTSALRSGNQTGEGVDVQAGAENNVAETDGDVTANRSAATLADGFIESFERRYPRSVLETLLADRTTGRNIIWADGEYEQLGEGYAAEDEITCEAIAGTNSGVIKPRVLKEQERQSKRTKARAEVFTPSWLVNEMANALDEDWFRHEGTFTEEQGNSWEPNLNRIEFPKSKGRGWHAYVSSTRLEITCGEAPFLCSRYDTVTGEALPVSRRIGVLDRKLRVVSERVKTYRSWAQWALVALKSTYGYEYQGDNLLIARINCLETFVEHCIDRWGVPPKSEDVHNAAWVISWNLWQMNGLTCAVPTTKLDAPIQSTLFDYTVPEQEPAQMALFDMSEETEGDGDEHETIGDSSELTSGTPLCVIYDWENDQPVEFSSLKGEVSRGMKKFYAVIGNPPYQISDGGHEASAAPVYHLMVQESKAIAERVVMVTPSRWFSGGKGLDDYRREMASDHHLRRLVDYPKLYEPFPNVKIRGGVSWFLWDADYCGPCKVQTMVDGKPASAPAVRYLDSYDVVIRRNEAVPILKKVTSKGEPTLVNRISARKPFGLPTNYHGPSSKEGIADPIRLYESQCEGWISREEISCHPEWIDDWKVLLNRVQGTSAAVETKFMSNPIIAPPGSACTETYLVAGRFATQQEAVYYASYLKTRFVRFLISLRKVTQDAARGVYSFVPDLPYDHSWTDS